MRRVHSAKKVAVVTQSVSPVAGGMFYSGRIPANLMADQGYPLTIFAMRDMQTDAALEHWQVPSMQIVEARGPRGYLSTSALLDSLRALAPDCVHLRGIWSPASWAAYRWKRKARLPLVISPHGMLDRNALNFSKLKKQLFLSLYERQGLESATVFHALNDSEASEIRNFGIKCPIAIIPNGVELGRVSTREESENASKTVIFLGRIHPKKGLMELVDGWAKFVSHDANNRSWRLDIAGWDDGNHLNDVLKKVASLGLENSVRYIGPLFGEEKSTKLRQSNAFILPTRSEGLPIAVLEAWEASLPVIMTREANLPIGFSHDAALETAAEPEAIAASLAKLAALPPKTRKKMGENGRRLVENQFDWGVISKDITQLYDWLLSHDKMPSFVMQD